MKRTIRNLIVAAPLATIALTMTPGAAMAFDPLPIGTPTPDPHPGPGDISDKPNPPKPPKGPGDLAIPTPKPTQPKPSQPTNPGGSTGGSTGGQQGTTAVAAKTDAKADKIEAAVVLPDGCLMHDAECNASAQVEQVAATADDAENGMELTWLLAGGAVVTASGIAFAARKRARSNA